MDERITRMDIDEYANIHGNRAAADLLLLAGYDGFAGTYEEYNELMEMLERVEWIWEEKDNSQKIQNILHIG